MGEVIDLSEKRQESVAHLSGEARCTACGHEWVAVAPLGCVALECPACHTMKGLYRHGCIPETHWVCNCGCDAFALDDQGNTICYNCGTYQQF